VTEFVPFDSARWRWGGAVPALTTHLGRECFRVGSTTATLTDVELVDGVVELELAVAHERGFHGVVWRVADDENYESFFVRPHQVGNPDAIQYTPVFNGLGGFQIYHGPGYWAQVSFPLDDWFRIRVAFAGARAEVYVADLDEPALVIGELKRPVGPGGIGVFVGGPEIHLAEFGYDANGSSDLRAALPEPAPRAEGVIAEWSISDAFPESALASSVPLLDDDLLAARTWSPLASEPSGLVDLARLSGIRDGKNTVFARTELQADRAETRALELGFSDRAVAYLNGRALYRGDDSYRSRDYRFLGSIGYFDTVYLPLEDGENELLVAVSEDFGGWAVQAKLV